MPESAVLAWQAWELMGYRFDWSALPVVCELLGIDDLERLVKQLVVLRDRAQG